MATFVGKAGNEIANQMYTFKDKAARDICLIPEVTGVIQEIWDNKWSKSEPRPMRLFYIQRCYRYERPQKGRYREFTQAGIEILGGKNPQDKEEAVKSLVECLSLFDISFELKESVKRGLNYYTEDGFEIEVESLGAQKQIAGGGRYQQGIGWAIGIDRLILAEELKLNNGT
jgi:histidyl-tRNA synthetase